jgi:hypothetical protein
LSHIFHKKWFYFYLKHPLNKMSIVDNKNDFLYKKNLGVVDAQGPTVSYQSETAGNARSRIISNLQLFAQPIPRDAPTDLGPKKYVKKDGSLDIDNKDNGFGTVQTSNTYPYIQYVDSLKLETASKYAYYFNNPGVSTNTNLLSNAIPYNYNNSSNTSWAYKVTSSNYSGNVDPSLYIVDTDAGYLYFVNTTDWTPYGTPYISFYRYNGTIGIPTNLGNFAGAYSQGTGAIAYGDSAGYTGQRANALAIGNFAGAYGQGTGSIAIGYLAGPTGMSANSIVLNASGTALAGTGPTGGFYVAPVASYSGSMGPFTLLAYGADKQIVSVTGDALTAMNIVGGGGGGGGGANYNIGNDIILSGKNSAVPTPQRPDNDDGGFYVSPILGYTGSSSSTFNVLGYGSSDKEVITLPITLNTKDVLTPMTINNNLQLPTLATGNLTYINNSGLLSSTDVTVAQLVNMSGVNPTNSIAIGNGAGAGQTSQAANSIAIGNGAGADISGLSNGTYTNWLKPSIVATNNITGVAMSAGGQIQLYGSSTSPNIYKSMDGGATFLPIQTSVFPSISSGLPYKFVVSGDGTCIIAFRQDISGGIITNFYISRDAGKTIGPTQSFQQAPLAFAISKTGDYIMLVSTGGIYITNSFSLNFNTALLSINNISTASCSMSSDRRYMMAIVNRTTLYVSSNYGRNFTIVTPISPPLLNLSLIALSGTGLYQLMSTTNTLYVSTNTGTSFALRLSIPSITIISSIAVSQTGQYMIACCSSTSVKGYVYYSTNFGANWQIMTALGQDNFNSCVISEDGILFTVSTPSALYTLNNSLIGNSVAIGNGAGQTNQPANTIAINTSGSPLNPFKSNGCYIAPIADASNSVSTSFSLLGYGSDNQIVKSDVFFNSNGSIINNYYPAKEDIGYFLRAGNASFYIGDDYKRLPSSSSDVANGTYARYFGTGGSIFQDFSGSFNWRPVTDASDAYNKTSGTCMILTNNGNLGIGITNPNPSFKLDVNGDIRANGATVNGNITTNGATVNGNISSSSISTGNITADGNIYTFGRLGVGTNAPSYSLDVNGVARTGSLLAGDITSTGNITATNVFSNSVSIFKIPIYSRSHQAVGIKVPTSGVYIVSALGESNGWYNFAIFGVNSYGNVVVSNPLIPVSNIYLNISNYEVTMLIPGGDNWLGENYKISVTRI